MSNRMTWGKFKEMMEKEGVKDNMKIDYIDINYPEEETPLFPAIEGDSFSLM